MGVNFPTTTPKLQGSMKEDAAGNPERQGNGQNDDSSRGANIQGRETVSDKESQSSGKHVAHRISTTHGLRTSTAALKKGAEEVRVGHQISTTHGLAKKGSKEVSKEGIVKKGSKE